MSYGYCCTGRDISGFTPDQIDAILKNKKNGGKRTHVERLLMAALGGSYNKSNIRADDYIPGLDQAIAQAKARDAAGEDYPTFVGSHVYKIVEKIILPQVISEPITAEPSGGDVTPQIIATSSASHHPLSLDTIS